MEFLTTIGSAVACGGVLFFLFCAGLLFWYLFNQPKQAVSATAPEPPVQTSIENLTAGASRPPIAPDETPGADG